MYKPENLLPNDVLERVEITSNIKALAEIFNKEMNFKSVTHRGTQILKNAGCETVGDVFFFMLDHHYEIGRKTAEDILFHLIETILPCNTCREYEKAFLLSKITEGKS